MHLYFIFALMAAIQLLILLPPVILIILLLRKIIIWKRFTAFEWVFIPLLAAYVILPFLYGFGALYLACRDQCQTSVTATIPTVKSLALIFIRERVGYSKSGDVNVSYSNRCEKTCAKFLVDFGLEFVEQRIDSHTGQFQRFTRFDIPIEDCKKPFELADVSQYVKDRICVHRTKVQRPSSKFIVRRIDRASKSSFLKGGAIRSLKVQISEIGTDNVLAKSYTAMLDPDAFSWHAVFGKLFWDDNGINFGFRKKYTLTEFDYSRVIPKGKMGER